MENEYYERNLQKIKDITGIFEIKDEVNDFLTDIKDEVDEFDFSQIYSLINLKYKVTNERKARIYITGANNNICYTKSQLNSFVEKCENAIEISVLNIFLISFKDNNIDVIEFKKIMEDLSIRLKSINTDLYFSNNLNSEGNINNYLSLEQFTELSRTIYIYLITNIDKDKFTPYDTSHLLPSNIIDDFNTFIKKYRIPSNDKNKLINIIRKGYINEGIYYDEYNILRKEMFDKSHKMHKEFKNDVMDVMTDITDEFDCDIEWSLDYDSYFNVDFIIKYKSKDFTRTLNLLDLLADCQSNFLSKNMRLVSFDIVLTNGGTSTSSSRFLSDGKIDFTRMKDYYIKGVIPAYIRLINSDSLLDFKIRIKISG